MKNKLYWLDICFNAMLEYIPENFTTADETDRFRRVAEHIDVIGSYLYTEVTANDSVAKFFSMAGIGHKETSNYELALDYYFKSVTIRQKNNNEQALGLVYNNIAVIYNIKAMYKSALDYYHKSIEISERLNSPPIDLIIAYNNFAIFYAQRSAYDDALEWNNKASKMVKDNMLTDNPINADVLIMRASVHYAKEEFAEALKLDFRALDILKCHYPEENANIGMAYNAIAREYFSLKKYDMALEYYQKAKRTYEIVYSENHSDTAEVYGSISKTYVALKNNDLALEWCLKALQSQEKTLGTEHPEVILRHSFLSEIYESMGLFEQAVNHLKIIHNYYLKVNHKDISKIVCERIAVNYENLGNLAESSKYRQMALGTGGCDE